MLLKSVSIVLLFSSALISSTNSLLNWPEQDILQKKNELRQFRQLHNAVFEWYASSRKFSFKMHISEMLDEIFNKQAPSVTNIKNIIDPDEVSLFDKLNDLRQNVLEHYAPFKFGLVLCSNIWTLRMHLLQFPFFTNLSQLAIVNGNSFLHQFFFFRQCLLDFWKLPSTNELRKKQKYSELIPELFKRDHPVYTFVPFDVPVLLRFYLIFKYTDAFVHFLEGILDMELLPDLLSFKNEAKALKELKELRKSRSSFNQYWADLAVFEASFIEPAFAADLSARMKALGNSYLADFKLSLLMNFIMLASKNIQSLHAAFYDAIRYPGPDFDDDRQYFRICNKNVFQKYPDLQLHAQKLEFNVTAINSPEFTKIIGEAGDDLNCYAVIEDITTYQILVNEYEDWASEICELVQMFKLDLQICQEKLDFWKLMAERCFNYMANSSIPASRRANFDFFYKDAFVDKLVKYYDNDLSPVLGQKTILNPRIQITPLEFFISAGKCAINTFLRQFEPLATSTHHELLLKAIQQTKLLEDKKLELPLHAMFTNPRHMMESAQFIETCIFPLLPFYFSNSEEKALLEKILLFGVQKKLSCDIADFALPQISYIMNKKVDDEIVNIKITKQANIEPKHLKGFSDYMRVYLGHYISILFIRHYSDYLLGPFIVMNRSVVKCTELEKILAAISCKSNTAAALSESRALSRKYLNAFYSLMHYWQPIAQRLYTCDLKMQPPLYIDASKFFELSKPDEVINTSRLILFGYHEVLKQCISDISSKLLFNSITVMRQSFWQAKNSQVFCKDPIFMTACDAFLSESESLPKNMAVDSLIALIEPYYRFFLAIQNVFSNVKRVHFESVLQLMQFLNLIITGRYGAKERYFVAYKSKQKLRMPDQTLYFYADAKNQISSVLDIRARGTQSFTPQTAKLTEEAKSTLQEIFSAF
jgi:hypothetical protein